jgi:transcriptional regulator with XRE-family HTH domain
MNRLKQLRYEKGVGLGDVAAAVKVARQTLGRLENSDNSTPSASTAKALAEFYGVSVPQLLGSEDLPPVSERNAA